MIDNYDFSKSARMKRFIRAHKKNFITLSISILILVLLLAIIIISAATDSDDYLTLENYEKIEIGMTLEEVVEALENHVGTVSGSGGRVYVWKDSSGKRRITIAVDRKGFVYSKSQEGLD